MIVTLALIDSFSEVKQRVKLAEQKRAKHSRQKNRGVHAKN